jgi:hypothetical protein
MVLVVLVVQVVAHQIMVPVVAVLQLQDKVTLVEIGMPPALVVLVVVVLEQ